MRLSLDVIRARKGDCLVLHYGTEQEPGLILIDGGPSNVFAPHLEPRINAIRDARGLGAQDSLPVDVLMVSHVDDDHIKGILDLTRKLREQKDAHEPLLVKVGTLWHNSFDDFVDMTPKELNIQAGFGTASLNDPDIPVDSDDFDIAKVLASLKQGRDLRLDAEVLKWKRNAQFGGKLILATDTSEPVKLDGGLELTVIGPLHAELLKLQKAHDEWLHDNDLDAQAALAAFSDRSIPNLSSLVVLMKAGGKTILLSGDARGDKLLDGLALKGIPATVAQPLHVDVLKVPHHGSSNNVTREFFQRVTANHYVFSGDGEHGNPERETLEMLFAARVNASFTLHFTYPIGDIDAEREKDWNKERAKEIAKGKPPREPWSKPDHSLEAFFQQNPLSIGQKIATVATPNARHVIDLLDPINF